MADRKIATVLWGGMKSRAALYGSALTHEPSGEVRLLNRLMPSGTTLQEWYSFTEYQAVRDTPDLPLLHHGRTYRIEPDLSSSPAGAVLFEVRCHDRFDELLLAEVLHGPAYSFAYPAQCHRYTIRLINAGCEELRFSSFTLVEVDADAPQ